jgi:hypothetical protein
VATKTQKTSKYTIQVTLNETDVNVILHALGERLNRREQENIPSGDIHIVMDKVYKAMGVDVQVH